MGGTGGHSLVMSYSGMHLQDGDKNECVGYPNNYEGKKYVEAYYINKNQLTDLSVRARENHDCWYITEKVMDHIRLTEREPECVSNVDGGIQKTNDIRTNEQPCADTCSHGGSIV